ncbi:MAG: hypothetical protein ACI80I_001569 [Akkermansiaceae bacterium]
MDGEALADGKDWTVNTDGLDHDVLDVTTIQNFAADLLGQETATISDLASYLRAQADGAFDDEIDAEVIAAFFQAGFGIASDVRTEAADIRFIPNAIGDGIRWDNKLNWSTEDIPGVQDGDSVDLAGNWVNYMGTTTLDNFDFGSGGELRVNQGKLTIEGDTTTGENGGTFEIDDAGQVWMNGYSDDDTLNVNVDGGRFANTGDLDGSVQIIVTDGDAILATSGASATFADDSSLHIVGDAASVGFDGTDGETAILRVGEGGSLRFEADDSGAVGSIEEFTSGAFGDESDVQSGVNLQDGTLQIILNENTEVGTQVLISADELVGTFDHIQIAGLSDTQDAFFTVDYETDEVFMTIVADGTGDAFYETQGDGDNAMDAAALWAALTDGMGSFDDTPPEIDVYDDEAALFAAY